MKKKFYVGFAAAALAGVMCVSLTACGNSVNAKSVVGEEVTQDEWNAAFAYLDEEDAQYTIEMTMEASGSESASYEGESYSYSAKSSGSMSAIKNGALEYVKMSMSIDYGGDYADLYDDEEEEYEVYGEQTDDGYYLYEQDEDGNWSKSKDSSGAALDEMWDEVGISTSYSSYEYNEDYKGYVRAYDTSEDLSEDNCVVIKFQDGKLVAIYMYLYESESYSESGYSTSYKEELELNLVITYEEKEITLPTVA